MPDPAPLHIGQTLLIPPMDGLLVKVGTKDTLASLAAKYKARRPGHRRRQQPARDTVVLGETLLIPGASGGAMPAPKTATVERRRAERQRRLVDLAGRRLQLHQPVSSGPATTPSTSPPPRYACRRGGRRDGRVSPAGARTPAAAT